MLAAVVRAVSAVYDEPAGAVGPAYDLRGADSVDLVEIVLQTEAALREAGLDVRVDDDTIGGWDDLAGFAGNVRAQLRVSTSAAPAREQHGVDRTRS